MENVATLKNMTNTNILLEDWDQLEPHWYYRIVGEYQLHLVIDSGAGWAISIRKNDLNIQNEYFQLFVNAIKFANDKAKELCREDCEIC